MGGLITKPVVVGIAVVGISSVFTNGMNPPKKTLSEIIRDTLNEIWDKQKPSSGAGVGPSLPGSSVVLPPSSPVSPGVLPPAIAVVMTLSD